MDDRQRAAPSASPVRCRRRLVLVPVRDYPDADSDYRDGIDEQVKIASAWWCDTATLHERAFTAVSPTSLDTRRDLETFLRDNGLIEAGPQDALVVYVTGHGYRGPSGIHYLLMSKGDPDRLSRDGFRTTDLACAVLDSDAAHVLVIVNTCFANAVHLDLHRALLDLPDERRRLKTLYVITSADFDERPRVREFSTLLARAADQLRTTAGIAGPELTIEEFVEELARAARRDPAMPLLEPFKVWPTGFSGTPTACLPNPGYTPPDDVVAPARQQVAVPASDLDYWLTRASGRPETTDSGWYFSGRQALSCTVNDFLAHGQGVLVVTGTTGTGKSAVIARAVTLTDSGFLADPRYAEAIRQAKATRSLPPPGSVDVAVVARNKSVTDLLTQILTATGTPPNPALPGVERIPALRTQVLDMIRGRRLSERPFTLVVDGFDEANDAVRLVTDLIVPLARATDDTSGPLVRLLIGIRSPCPSDRHDDTADHGLLDLLLRAVQDRRPDICRTDGPDAQVDIAAYLSALLARGRGYYSTTATQRHAVSQIISAHVAPSFLDARLAATRLLDLVTPPSLDDPAWLASLSEGTVGQLRLDLTDLATSNIPPHHLLAVLRAAAFALGDGVPWAEVWPAMARTVLGAPLPNADLVITYVLHGRLGGYLLRGVEDGRIVYGPAHNRLAHVLREQSDDLLKGLSPGSGPSNSPEKPSPSQTIHARIAEELARLVPPDLPPHPYLRRHLLAHAARGGVLNDDTVPERFLPWENSGTARGLVGLPLHRSTATTAVGSWAALEPYLGDVPPLSRAVSLAFWRQALIDPRHESPSQPSTTVLETRFLRPRWTRWPLTPNVIAAISSPVQAVTAFPSPDGHPLLATGNDDGTVGIWDPATGAPVGQPLTGHTDTVQAVTSLPGPDRRTLLATGSRDGTVRIWDPTTGDPVGQPLTGHTGGVRAVAVLPAPDGHALLASGGDDGTVRIWDPTTGNPVGQPLTGHTGWVWAVTSLPGPDGRALLASGSWDGTVRIWDPTTGNPVGQPLTGHTGRVWAVTSLPGPDGRTLLATGSTDGTVRIWDPTTGNPIGQPLTGHTDTVQAVTTLPGPDGHTLLATGSDDSTVRIWDPISGALVGGPLTGHTDWVRTVVTLPVPHGNTLIVTGSDDGTVRIWDPTCSTPIGRPLTGHTGGVWAVAALPGPDGRTLLASGSDDRTIRIWNPATGVELVRLITGAPVYTLCVHDDPAERSEVPFLAIAGDRRLAVLDLIN